MKNELMNTALISFLSGGIDSSNSGRSRVASAQSARKLSTNRKLFAGLREPLPNTLQVLSLELNPIWIRCLGFRLPITVPLHGDNLAHPRPSPPNSGKSVFTKHWL
jgi:hypothetical protein